MNNSTSSIKNINWAKCIAEINPSEAGRGRQITPEIFPSSNIRDFDELYQSNVGVQREAESVSVE